MPSAPAPAPKVLLLCLLLTLTLTVRAERADATIDVWVDPGHGNLDAGTLGIDGPGHPNEADLTMPTASSLYDWLISFGYDVHLTRNSEANNSAIHLKPRARTRILNGLDPNDESPPFTDSARIIISIHMDAACNPKGVCDSTQHKTTIFWNPLSGPRYTYNFSQSFGLALAIHPDVKSEADVAFLPCRGDGGVQIGNFFMIRDVHAPAALVEVCKLTNRCQFNLIQNSGVQSQMAYGIASGITHYMNPGGFLANPSIVTSAGLMELASRARARGVSVAAFARPVSISTRTTATTASFQEGFEGGTFPPVGWTRLTSGAPVPHNWGRTTDPLILQSGVGAAIVSGQYASANDEWLVSPMVKVSATDVLSFHWAGNSALAGAANATCQVRPKGAGSWTALWSLVTEPAATAFVYRERAISLASYVGDSIQFAFRVQGTYGPDFAVDDVAIGAFTPTSQPANDHCGGASALPAGSFSLTGVTTYASNDISPALTTLDCLQDDMDGSDVIYRLNALVGDTLSAAVTGNWNPGLYLVDACTASPNCLAGQYPLDPGSYPAAFDYVFSSAGTYYLVVDGPAGESGPFTLSGTFRGSVTDVPSTSTSEAGLAMHPNPARGFVNFSGTAPTDLNAVRITILDIAGRRVAALDVPVSGGRFAVKWDRHDSNGARVPAGVYFGRLEVGSIVSRRGIVLTD